MSTIRIHNIILLLLLFAIPSVALGQFSFIAKSNKYTVGKNETIKVTFTWDAGGDGFSPPPFENFKIVAGPMQGSNYSNINGKVSNTISRTYHLRALNIGTFNIDKASVVYNGKTFY